MAYSAGILNKRIKIARRVAAEMGAFGKNSAGQKYELLGTFWANETWSKGVKSLREGALDAYDTVMIRMRWTPTVTRDSRLQHDGVTYQIQSLHRDYQSNIVQITATEII